MNKDKPLSSGYEKVSANDKGNKMTDVKGNDMRCCGGARKPKQQSVKRKG